MARPKSQKKIKEIHSMAARLFAHRGYHHTSLRKIARELGMNQSSLYHYFTSKEDVLFRLMNDAMDHVLVELEEIFASDLPAEDKLKKVLHSYIRSYAGDQERLILLVNEMNSLKETNRLILVKKQRQYVQLIKSIMIGDIDLMENLGIYEVAEEDMALCEFVCTSKIEVQSILRQGFDKMIKELG